MHFFYQMTEKDNVSMSTVQMKPDYAASEVYSTTSEAPPAYKRQSNSVKIAKITAFTVITASFILGSFILASAYLSAKASCDQVQALDSVLEKELMLETLQQVGKEAPRAEALLGKDNKLSDDNDLQNYDLIDESFDNKKLVGKGKQRDAANEDDMNNNNNDNTIYADSDNDEDVQKFQSKVPLELDMSDLAAALLQNNKKSRMNCVVERKHAEEIVDSPSKTVALPFGVNLTTDPKKARITGERISIYCEGGNENREQDALNGRNNNNQNNNNYNREEDEDNDIDSEIEALRPMFVPYQRIPIPFGPVMQQYPLTHMPQRMLPPMTEQQQAQIVRQLPPPFQQQQQLQQQQFRPPQRMLPPQQIIQAPRPDLPQQIQHHMMMMQELPQHNQYQQQEQQQQQPQQQQTVRIHVQEMPYHEIHMADDVPVQIPTQHQELPHFQIQRLPLGLALQRAGITAEDLRNIQRIAEDRITDELRHLGAENVSESTEKNNNNNVSDEEETDESVSDSDEQQQRPMQQQQQDQIIPPVQSEQKARPMAIQRLILQQLPEQPRDTMSPPMPNDAQAPTMMYGRANFGRSLVQPVRIPVPMMQPQAAADEDSAAVASEAERPHFVQPRSV